MSKSPPLLAPEGGGVPTYKERAEQCYEALEKLRGRCQFGQPSMRIDVIELEGLMGILSNHFEGVP